MKYQSSETFGDIPADWQIVRFKDYFSFGKGLPITKKDLTEDGIPVISYGQIHSKLNDGIHLTANLLRFVDESFSNTYHNSSLSYGDMVFADTSEDYEGIGNASYVDIDGVYAGYHTIICHPKYKEKNSYLAYLFSTDIWRDTLRISASGIKVFSVTKRMLSDTKILLPPIHIQEKIVTFLDDKCMLINGIIEDITTQIKILEEYKKSIISEVVTKGLNSNIQMRNSKIKWIDEYPKHWKVARFKDLFSLGKGLSITKEDLLDDGVYVISYGQIHSKNNNFINLKKDLLRYVSEKYFKSEPNALASFGDIIFADTSEDYDGIGNAIYVDSNDKIFAGYHTIICKPQYKNINSYFAYLFSTNLWRSQLRTLASGIKVFSITQKMLKSTYLLVPPLDEQIKIVEYLDSKCSEIESIIFDKKSQLETLEAYKKSLIYEYVTGKKEVPA